MASSEGYVLLFREIDEADYGNGLTFPVRIQFKSQPGQGSQYLGPGWQLSMLECNSGLYQEGMMRALLPCGKRLWLYSKKRGSNDFETLDQEWKGKLENKLFTVSRKDGWLIRYSDGRLMNIRTPEGRVLQWVYEGKNAVAVSEGGKRAVQIHTNSEGKIDGLTVNGREHKIGLGQRPRMTEIEGRRLVEALDPVLTKWIFPDGSTEEYEFSLDSERFPTLSVKSKEDGGDLYSWDPKTGYIRKENGWKYEVIKGSERFAAPKLARFNSSGVREEFSEDDSTGIATTTERDGSKVVFYKFKALGPLYEKVQKIERVEKDGSVKTMLKLAYDEKGQIISKTDEKGFITSFTYDDKGGIKGTAVRLLKNPKLITELAEREKALLKRISVAGNEGEKGDALQALGFFYITDMGEPAKAMALIPQMRNRQQIFNISFQSVFSDRTLRGKEKAKLLEKLLAEYPDKSELLTVLIDSSKREVF